MLTEKSSDCETKQEEKNTRLQAVISDTEIGFWYTDLPSMEPSADDNARRLFGVSPGISLDYSEFFDRLHPDDRSRIRAAVDKSLTEGSPYDEEYRVILPEGQARWVRAIGRVTRSHFTGEKVRFDGVVLDISHQKLVSERLQAVANATSQILYFADPEGNPIGDNSSWRQFTGQSIEDIRDGRWTDAVHPQDRNTVVEIVSRALADQVPYEVENRLRRKDGEWRHMLVRGVPLFNLDGRVREWVGACQDITERKQLELDLRTAVAMREEFISIASHELKTPLTALSLRLDMIALLAKETPSEAGDKIVALSEKALHAGQRLVSLLNELLDLGRIEAGKLMLVKQEVDLKASVESALLLMSEEIAKSASTVEMDMPEPIVGSWDQTRINQVILNLISNAIKYGGGKSVQIRGHINPVSHMATLEVQDRGVGIAPEKQHLIFQRFERITSGSKISGLGLGLYIARQIVEAHGGTIHVESTLGEGSLFVVELPLK